jgi:hypothetical protein
LTDFKQLSGLAWPFQLRENGSKSPFSSALRRVFPFALGVIAMVDARTEVETGMGEAHGIMFEDIFLLVFCFILAIGGLAIVVWEFATGRFFNIDGLWLNLISLTLAVVFGGNIAWSVYTGELQAILRSRRKEPEVRSEAEEAK